MTAAAGHDISPSKSRTLLIGWDAAEWKVIRPLLAQGLMPYLAGLMARGESGALQAGQPLLSPTIWTSIVTGRHPTEHGVLGAVEISPHGLGLVPVGRSTCEADPIWSLLDGAGVACHAINFPATHPAEPLRGVSISNCFATGRDVADSVWPLECRAALAEVRVRPQEIDAASLLTIVPRAKEIDPRGDPRLGQIAEILASAATVHAAATWTLEHVPWEFAAICYTSLHQFSHGFMMYHPPRLGNVSERDFELYGQVVTAAYRFHDMMLGRLLDLAGPQTQVMLVSDHGFHCDHQRPTVVSSSEHDMLLWHRPQGIFVTAGPGITPRTDPLAITPFDIAPTILACFGLRRPPSMRGRAICGSAPTLALPRSTGGGDKTASPVSPLAGEMPIDPNPLPGSTALTAGEYREREQWSARSDDSVQYLRRLGYAELPDTHAQFEAERLENRRDFYLAIAWLDARRPQQAIALLEPLLQKNPDDLESRIALAHAYYDARRTDDCRRLVDESLRIYPQSPLAAAAAGMLELAARRAKIAIGYFRLAEQKGLRTAGMFLDVGRAYLRLRMFDDAKRSFQRAIDLDDELPAAFSGLGKTLLGEGDAFAAVEAVRKAIVLAPGEAKYHYELGNALVQLGQLDEARLALQDALHLDSQFAPALRKLGDVCQRLGQVMQAREYHRVAQLVAARRRIAQFEEPDMAQPTAD